MCAFLRHICEKEMTSQLIRSKRCAVVFAQKEGRASKTTFDFKLHDNGIMGLSLSAGEFYCLNKWGHCMNVHNLALESKVEKFTTAK